MLISKESINYSLRNLKHRKSRSFLTILSIFVGITTIFIFLSFGLGLVGYINELTSSSSADKVLIMPKGSGAPGMDQNFALTEKELEIIEKTSGVFDVAGVYFKPAEVKQGNKIIYTFLIGYDPKKSDILLESIGISIENGRNLQSSDEGKVVLGYNYQIPNKIFPKPYKLNDKIEVQGKKLKIIGFFESIGSPPDDSQIYVTNDYMPKLYPDENLSYGEIIARVDIDNLNKVVENIEKNLRKERNLEKGKEDFYVQSFDDLIEQFSSALNIMIGFVILIAFISVIVSAVNTANTMITSVLERTKEIGVIKSIGAKNSEVLKIFLFESSFLGFVAGVIGVTIGWLLSSLGGAILDNLGWGFLSPNFSPYLFIGLIAFATITGAISGVIPAIRASKINPVDALRYE